MDVAASGAYEASLVGSKQVMGRDIRCSILKVSKRASYFHHESSTRSMTCYAFSTVSVCGADAELQALTSTRYASSHPPSLPMSCPLPWRRFHVTP